jgi:hypothetical protein
VFTVTLKTAGGQTITATDTVTLTIVGNATVTVSPASANKLTFGQQPTNTPLNNTITPAVTVLIEDQFGNTVTSSSASVTVALTSAGGATLSGTLTKNAVNGVATFNDLSVNLTGTYSLTATSTGLTNGVSNNFTINVNAPVNTVSPVVSGSTVQGSVLSCTTGTWLNSPTSFAYQWYNQTGIVTGATGSTYVTRFPDVGGNVYCAVTATNAGGSNTANSNLVGPITAASNVGFVILSSGTFPDMGWIESGSPLVNASTGKSMLPAGGNLGQLRLPFSSHLTDFQFFPMPTYLDANGVLDDTLGMHGILPFTFGDTVPGTDNELIGYVPITSPAGWLLAGIRNVDTTAGGAPTTVQRSWLGRLSGSNGYLDRVFGNEGTVTFNEPGNVYIAGAYVVQLSTGAIITVGGYCQGGVGGPAALSIWRTYANGNTFPGSGSGFNASGRQAYQYAASKNTFFNAVFIDTSDRIYIIGNAQDGSGVSGIFCARWLSDGTPDTAWGGSGSASNAFYHQFTHTQNCDCVALVFPASSTMGNSFLVLVCQAATDTSTYGHTQIVCVGLDNTGAVNTSFNSGGSSPGYTFIPQTGLHGSTGNDGPARGSFQRVTGNKLRFGITCIDDSGMASGWSFTGIMASGQLNSDGSQDTNYGTPHFAPGGVDTASNTNYQDFPGPLDTDFFVGGHLAETSSKAEGFSARCDGLGNPVTGWGDPVGRTYAAVSQITTNAATSVGQTGATLNATVTTGAANATVCYQWGLSANFGYGQQDYGTVLANQSGVSAPITISGLLSGFTYYFQAYSFTGSGASRVYRFGGIQSFTTTSGATNTLLVDNYTDTNGTVIQAHIPDTCYFGRFGVNDLTTGTIQSNKFQVGVTGGSECIISYDVGFADVTVTGTCTYAGSGADDFGLALRVFSPTSPSTGILGALIDTGSGKFIIYDRGGGGFVASKTVSPIASGHTYTFTAQAIGAGVTASLSIDGGAAVYLNYQGLSGSLTPTTHGFEGNISGDTFDALTIQTNAAPITTPIPVTGAASSITSSGATLNGTIAPMFNTGVTYDFEYGLTTSYGTHVPGSPVSVASDAGTYGEAQSISGLTTGTLYHFRINAYYGASSVTHGADVTFTTS